MTGLNPLNWYGTEFLILYGALFVVAGVVSWWVEQRLRPKGHDTALPDEDSIAVLGAGRVRLAETTIARMLERGSMQMDNNALRIADGVEGRTAAEKAIIALGSPVRWDQVDRAMRYEAQDIEQTLIKRRMILPKGEAIALGFNAATPFLMLFCFGLGKLLLGVNRNLPVGFLMACLGVTALVALWRWFGLGRHTHTGRAAIKRARDEAARLQIAPTGPEMGMAVALFGTGVIATSPIGDFHRMRENASGGAGDAGSNNDGDGGGSGCGSGSGGGGCGGCGGG